MKIGVIEFLFIYYLNKTEINQIYVICAFRKLAVFFFPFYFINYYYYYSFPVYDCV